MSKNLPRPIQAGILLSALLIYLVIYGVNYWRNKDVWSVFQDNPPGYQIEYPSNWNVRDLNGKFYRGRNDIYVIINNSQLGFIADRELTVYWKADENPTMRTAKEWGTEIIANHQGQSRPPYTQRLVGSKNYEALELVYFAVGGRHKQIYLVSHDGIFIIEYSHKNGDLQAEEIFEKMLNSFTLLEPIETSTR